MKNNQHYTIMITGMAKAGTEEYVKNYLIELMKHSRNDEGGDE